MTPEAQAFYEESFLPRYKALREKVRTTPLTVLIWGPGSGGDPLLYRKRLQIRGELRTWGLTALFSEEIDVGDDVIGLSAKANELCQAIEADFIIVLQASPGSVGEAHDFAEFVGGVGSKMVVFIDEQARGGYSYAGALYELRVLYKNVETYSYPEDIVTCNLLGSVKSKVSVLQAVKWRAGVR